MKLISTITALSAVAAPTLPVAAVVMTNPKNNQIKTSNHSLTASQRNSLMTLNDYNAQFKAFMEHKVSGVPYAVNVNQNYLNNVLFPKRTLHEIRTADSWVNFPAWCHCIGKQTRDHAIDFAVTSETVKTSTGVSIGGNNINIIPLFHNTEVKQPNWYGSGSIYEKLLQQTGSTIIKDGKLGWQSSDPFHTGDEDFDYSWCGDHHEGGGAVGPRCSVPFEAWQAAVDGICDWTQQYPSKRQIYEGRQATNIFVPEGDSVWNKSKVSNDIFDIYDYGLTTTDMIHKAHWGVEHENGWTFLSPNVGGWNNSYNNFKDMGFARVNKVHYDHAWLLGTNGNYSTVEEVLNANPTYKRQLSNVIPQAVYAFEGSHDGSNGHIWGMSFLSSEGANTNLAKILNYNVDKLLQLSYVGYNSGTNKYYLNIQLNDEILAAALGQFYNKQLIAIIEKDWGNLVNGKYIPEEWKAGGNCWINWNDNFYFHDVLGISDGDTEFKGGTNTWVPHKLFTDSGTEEWSDLPLRRAVEQKNYGDFCTKIKQFVDSHLFKGDNYQIHYDNYLKLKWFSWDYWKTHTIEDDWQTDFLNAIDMNKSEAEAKSNSWYNKAVTYKMTDPNIDYCYFLALILPQLKISTWIDESLNDGGSTHPYQDKFVGSNGKTYASGYDLLDFGQPGQPQGVCIELEKKPSTQSDVFRVKFNGESLASNYPNKNVTESTTGDKKQGFWSGCVQNVDKLSKLTDFDGSGGAIQIDEDYPDQIRIAAEGKMAQSANLLNYYGVPIAIEPQATLTSQAPSKVWNDALVAASGDKITALKSIFVDNYLQGGVPRGTPACPIVTFNMYNWTDIDCTGENLPKNTVINVANHDKYGEMVVKLDRVDGTGEVIENLATFRCFDFYATPSQNISFDTKSHSTDQKAVKFTGKFKKVPIDNLATVALTNKEGTIYPLKLTETTVNVDASGNFYIEVQYETSPASRITNEFSLEFTYQTDEGYEVEDVTGMSVIFDPDINEFVVPLPGQSTEKEVNTKSSGESFIFSISKSECPEKTTAIATDAQLIRASKTTKIDLPVNQVIQDGYIKVTADLSGFEHQKGDVVKFNLNFNDTMKATTIPDYKLTFTEDAPGPTPTPSNNNTAAIVGGSVGGTAAVTGGTVGTVKGVKSHNLKKKEKEFDSKNKKDDDKK